MGDLPIHCYWSCLESDWRMEDTYWEGKLTVWVLHDLLLETRGLTSRSQITIFHEMRWGSRVLSRQRSRIKCGEVTTHLNKMLLFPDDKVLVTTVERNAGDVHPFVERHHREILVHSACSNCGYPWCDMGETNGIRAAVLPAEHTMNTHISIASNTAMVRLSR